MRPVVGRQAELGPPHRKRRCGRVKDDPLGDRASDRHAYARHPAQVPGEHGSELAGLVHEQIRAPTPAGREDAWKRRASIHAGEHLAHGVAVHVALGFPARASEPRLAQSPRRLGHVEDLKARRPGRRRSGAGRGEGHRAPCSPDRLGKRQQRTHMPLTARRRKQRPHQRCFLP